MARGCRLVARLDTLPKDSIGRAFLELDDPDLGGKLDIKQLTSNVAFFIAAGVCTCACVNSHHTLHANVVQAVTLQCYCIRIGMLSAPCVALSACCS